MKKILLILFLGLFVSTAARADGAVVVRTVNGTFTDVRERVIFAVEGQGLVVDHISKVGDMLERTGKDLGATSQVFGQAEVLEFCSALVSRQMVEADPPLLAFCPYGIAVYTLPENAQLTYVAYRRLVTATATPAQKPVLERVEALLAKIVEEAAM